MMMSSGSQSMVSKQPTSIGECYPSTTQAGQRQLQTQSYPPTSKASFPTRLTAMELHQMRIQEDTEDPTFPPLPPLRMMGITDWVSGLTESPAESIRNVAEDEAFWEVTDGICGMTLESMEQEVVSKAFEARRAQNPYDARHKAGTQQGTRHALKMDLYDGFSSSVQRHRSRSRERTHWAALEGTARIFTGGGVDSIRLPIGIVVVCVWRNAMYRIRAGDIPDKWQNVEDDELNGQQWKPQVADKYWQGTGCVFTGGGLQCIHVPIGTVIWCGWSNGMYRIRAGDPPDQWQKVEDDEALVGESATFELPSQCK